MLSKKNRLAKDQDIKKVFAQGRSFFNPHFSVRYFRTSGSARFTVVVSTQVSKRATRRNRVKRILRETLKKNLVGLAFGDYIIIVKPPLLYKDEVKFLASFEDLLIKAKLLKHE